MKSFDVRDQLNRKRARLTFVVFRRQSRKFRVARREFHSKETALWILEGHRVRLFRQRMLDMTWFGVNTGLPSRRRLY